VATLFRLWKHEQQNRRLLFADILDSANVSTNTTVTGRADRELKTLVQHSNFKQ